VELIESYRITLTSRQWQALARETSWHFAGHHAPSCLECGGYNRLVEIGRSTQANSDDMPVAVEESISTIVTMRTLAYGLGFDDQIVAQFQPQLVEADRIAKINIAERAAWRERRRTGRN